MEFANGNYALLAQALAYENDTTAPEVDAVTGSDRAGDLQERRGRVDLLHAGRLDAHHRLDGVQAEPAA